MQVEREIKMVSKHTGLKPWMVFAIVGVVVVLVLLGIAVCVWRFCRSVNMRDSGISGKLGVNKLSSLFRILGLFRLQKNEGIVASDAGIVKFCLTVFLCQNWIIQKLHFCISFLLYFLYFCILSLDLLQNKQLLYFVGPDFWVGIESWSAGLALFQFPL